MSVTSTELVDAIASDRLSTRLIVDGDLFAVGVLIDDVERARIGMLHIDRPHAKVADDGLTVDVFPSSGLPDGFAIAGDGHEAAELIAESLNDCFETTYLELMDKRS
jgi:hypothetical protein